MKKIIPLLLVMSFSSFAGNDINREGQCSVETIFAQNGVVKFVSQNDGKELQALKSDPTDPSYILSEQEQRFAPMEFTFNAGKAVVDLRFRILNSKKERSIEIQASLSENGKLIAEKSDIVHLPKVKRDEKDHDFLRPADFHVDLINPVAKELAGDSPVYEYFLNRREAMPVDQLVVTSMISCGTWVPTGNIN
ncbi:MAG: hypothetical protein ACJ76H_08110 [Bacteriovoracaceae bacterium]